jgi:signal peptidase I
MKHFITFFQKTALTKNNVFYVSTLLSAVIFRTTVLDVRYIPSESMLPTLEINDRVGGLYTYQKMPKRDDIIVFRPDYLYDTTTKERINPIVLICGASGVRSDSINVEFVKRVIGLPGDTLDFTTNGLVKRNGEILKTPQARGKTLFPDIRNNFLPTNQSIVVSPNHVFVMGDNRERSCDSRFWGSVPIKNIISKSQIRFWPPNRIGFLK